ncbi:tumor necrosis factor receptor superfamily member 1B isoform 3-T3 [Spinachia spinachia]
MIIRSSVSVGYSLPPHFLPPNSRLASRKPFSVSAQSGAIKNDQCALSYPYPPPTTVYFKEAMKEILVVLLLLKAQTLKVCSQPYQADADGNCLNSTTEYLLEGSNLCCKKCPPGQRQTQKCSETTETVCERCPTGLFMETWNYAPNCFPCTKCKEKKGVQEAQVCSSTERSRCVCQPGMFCLMDFDAPFCTACSRYKHCQRGEGVSEPGTANTNVRCKRCPSGTFSDSVSNTQPCLPHTDCNGRVVVRKGNATSDNVCEAQASAPPARPAVVTRRPRHERAFAATSAAAATSDSEAPRGQTETTLSINTSYSRPEILPAPGAVSGATLGEAARFNPKVDVNENCDRVDKLVRDYLVETDLNYSMVPSPEHQILLQKGETCSDHSRGSDSTDALTQTDGSSSQESIEPLRSTVAFRQLSVPSDPMTLLPHTEAAALQPNVPARWTSQPTSPQVTSPVTTSPHVNVNITFHIENRSNGTLSVPPTDLMQVDSELPFGEEEESFSIPHQEAGKPPLMSVQESYSCRA